MLLGVDHLFFYLYLKNVIFAELYLKWVPMQNLFFSILLVWFANQLFAQEINSTSIAPQLSVFAQSKHQWTGIAVSGSGRVFVNFPRWSAETPVSVAEIVNGQIIPYPNREWNNWNNGTNKTHQFICVQSVFIDDLNLLWILDTGQELQSDSTKAAHLYVFSLKTNRLEQEYTLPAAKISGKSYLNDLRIDHKKQVVYLTDSDVGGLVILDLQTNEIRRVLEKHYSTRAEVSKITIDGYVRTHPVNSDGIALDRGNRYLYYSSLMGENVYRIATKALLNKNLNDSLLGTQVEKFAKTGANDGIIFDKKGNLYLTSLEKNGISRLDKRGRLQLLIQDDAIKWPDSFAFEPNGDLLFTISQIHLPKEKRGPYKIFRLKLTALKK